MRRGSTVRARMCAVFSEENGEDPCGSAPAWTHCIVVETPPPWREEVTDSPSFPAGVAALLSNHPDVRLQAVRPDDAYSVEGYSRLMLFSRPDGMVREMSRLEYLVPSHRLPDALRALLDGGEREDIAEWRQGGDGMRDILVCTHGSRDTCCGSLGHPTYSELRSRHSSDDVRVWRQSHTGGHRLAPNVIEFPSGRYWSRLTPERASQMVGRSGILGDLHGAYRGWAAVGSPRAQIAEREAFMREGWDWMQRVIECEVMETSDDGLEERIAVRSVDQSDSITAYEATVRQNGTAQSIECMTGALGKEYPRYELARFERIGS